ncbi:hypothetical protein LCGC14_0467840 [marine sediment metagenome]|uniref:DUF262 domain-containing protein n=1 Tax=marine sediment metagenome TaxID=412755 RepID=A0A0F9SW18_9ZZZZ|nr:DUF262 domain-containing protein [Methylophaga sp.]HEC58781.1 DUF262 domain-containing protein [Methylophaga sp.]
MKITPTTLTLSQLFSSTNEQFVIPAYQRRYSWQEKQLGELFDDIHHLKTNDTHLLGSLVCLTFSHTAGLNPLEIVDGQQRITSLSIFLKVMQNRFLELGNEEVASEIGNYLVCKGIDRKPMNKILLGDLDNTDYSSVLSQQNLDDVKNKNLVMAYNKLKEWVAQLTDDALNELYFKFINNVLLIRLDVGEAKDAFRLFETINNRGLKLDSTDIIKNFLLGHASTISEDTIATVRENWKNLIINLDRIDSDKFFRQFMSGIRTYKVTDTYIIDEFKKYYFHRVKEAENLSEYELYSELAQPVEYAEEIEDELIDDDLDDAVIDDVVVPLEVDGKISIIEFSTALRNASLTYRNILNREFSEKKINQHVYNLQRIKSFPSYIFLLDLFQRQGLNLATYIDILKVIETFMLRRHICEYRTSELDNIFAKLIPLSNDNIVEEIKNQLRKDLPTDAEFQDKFESANFKREINRAKYILEKLEYHLIGDQGEYILQSGSDVHLEHIIPQTIDTKKSKKEFGDWESYLCPQGTALHRNYVNKIGNFTLIAGGLNIVASNNPFSAKMNEYKNSNIQLTKNLCHEYSAKHFDFGAVQERCKLFAATAVEIWRL